MAEQPPLERQLLVGAVSDELRQQHVYLSDEQVESGIREVEGRIAVRTLLDAMPAGVTADEIWQANEELKGDGLPHLNLVK